MEADRTRRQSEGPPSAAILAETRQTCRFNHGVRIVPARVLTEEFYFKKIGTRLEIDSTGTSCGIKFGTKLALSCTKFSTNVSY